MEFCGIILNYALLYGAVLLLGAISGYLSERAGIVNIGIDGMMCFGVVFFGIFSSPLIGVNLKIAHLDWIGSIILEE